jgi:uncharacterized protein (TIGR02611 family)
MMPPTSPPPPPEARISWWRCLPRLAGAQWRCVPRPARQVCVALLGFAVLAVGVAMIVLPGPAVLIIPLGFAILATEFPWAHRLLDRARARGDQLKQVCLARWRAAVKSSPTPG